MAGVGDKLLLLLRAADHRVDGAAAQQHHQPQHQQRADRVRRQGPHQHRPHGAAGLIAFQENGHAAPVLRTGHQKAVAAAAAVARAVGDGGGQVFRRIRLGNGGDVLQVGAHQRAVLLIEEDEITGGVGRLRREGIVPAGAGVVCRGCIAVRAGLLRRLPVQPGDVPRLLREGNGAAVIADELQGASQVGIGGGIVGHVEDRRQQQHYRRHRQRGNTNETVAEPVDHVSSSNT